MFHYIGSNFAFASRWRSTIAAVHHGPLFFKPQMLERYRTLKSPKGVTGRAVAIASHAGWRPKRSPMSLVNIARFLK
jgi:hypothetical protein